MVSEEVFATHEIIALLGTSGSYKIRVRELSSGNETEYSVSDSTIETANKRYPHGIFGEFKNDVVITDGSLNETKLLEMLDRTYDKHLTADGRMNLGEKH